MIEESGQFMVFLQHSDDKKNLKIKIIVKWASMEFLICRDVNETSYSTSIRKILYYDSELIESSSNNSSSLSGRTRVDFKSNSNIIIY